MNRLVFLAALLAGLSISVPAGAAPEQPQELQRLLACRTLAEATERLRCFDQETAALKAATDRSELLVMDRQQIRRTQRSLFGLTLPRLPFLEGGKGDGQPPAEIEGVIKQVRTTREGKWVVTLDDATWQTTEVSAFEAPPEIGSKVKIRRARLGSYVLAAEGRRGLRAIRLR